MDPPATAIACGSVPASSLSQCCRLVVTPGSIGQLTSQLILSGVFLGAVVIAWIILLVVRKRQQRSSGHAGKYIVLNGATESFDGYNSQGDTINGDAAQKAGNVQPATLGVVPLAYVWIYSGLVILALLELIFAFLSYTPATHVVQTLLWQLNPAVPIFLLCLFFWRDWTSKRAFFLSSAFALVYFGVSSGMAIAINRAIAASQGSPRIDVVLCPTCPVYFFDTMSILPPLIALLIWLVGLISSCCKRLRGPASLVLVIAMLALSLLRLGPAAALAADLAPAGVCLACVAELLWVIAMPAVLLAVMLRDSRTDAIPTSDDAHYLLRDSTLSLAMPVGANGRMHQAQPAHYQAHMAAPRAASVAAPATLSEGQRIAKFLLDNLDESVRIIDFDSVVREQKIGSGGFGEVFRGTLNGEEVALKRALDIDEKKAKTFLREINTMARLEHPNITRLVGVAFSDNDKYFITEFVERGSLFDLIHGRKKRQAKTPISWANVLTILNGTCEGMAFLHGMDPPFLHRDLKSQNLLIGDNWLVKICDFGMSRVRSLGVTMTKLGTLQWVAPEVLRDERYTESADTYSFAILVWELVARAVPYVGQNSLMVARAVAYKSLRPVVPDNCPDLFRNLMATCWTDAANERPSFPDILKLLESIDSETANSWPPPRH